jgi:hypothetical protein
MKCLFLVLFFLRATTIMSQSASVNGIVQDDHGHPISGAKIDVVGKNPNAVTDDDGIFILNFNQTSPGNPFTIKITKQGFNVRTLIETLSSKPILVIMQHSKLNSGSYKPNAQRRLDNAKTNAPKAQIVTQGQIGDNTINNFYGSAKKDTIDLKTNAAYQFVDSLTLLVWPPQGEWSTPFFALKTSERDCLSDFKPHNSMIILEQITGYTQPGNAWYYSWYKSPSATTQDALQISFKKLPSMLVFGELNDSLQHYLLDFHALRKKP